MRSLGDGLTFAIGALLLLLSGACTLSVAPGMLIPYRLPSGAPGLWSGLSMTPLIALVGGLPMGAGATLMVLSLNSAAGGSLWWALRRALCFLIFGLGALVALSWGVGAVLILGTESGGGEKVLAAAVMAAFAAAGAWAAAGGWRAAFRRPPSRAGEADGGNAEDRG